MDEFCEFVDGKELLNLPISRARFTWSNLQERASRSKLDRFQISMCWDEIFSSVCVQALPRVGSNHCPILLKGGDVAQLGPRPFRFQNMWLIHPGFVDLVKDWWESIEVQGPPS